MSLERLFGAEHGAFASAVAARQPFVARPRPEVLSAMTTDGEAWLAALSTLLTGDRMAPRAQAQHVERGLGSVTFEPLAATDTVAVLGAGDERWTLHGARELVHDLAPGSVVYLPAGRGVSVATHEPARLWYLRFTFPSWLDIVANTAMLELGAERSWREPGDLDDDDAAVAAALVALTGVRLP